MRKKLNSMNPRVKELERLVEQQAQAIEDMRKSSFRIPAGRKKSRGKTFLRLCIPDTHGAHLDKEAARAFLQDLDDLKPAEVVWMGDHIDCSGFLAQHHAFGFVPECAYSFEDDVNAANHLLDEVSSCTGKVDTWYLSGNHCARVEKWIVKQTLNHPRDAAYLTRMFGPEQILGLEKRGVEYIRRDRQYSGLRVRGTIKLGKCHYRHGTRTGVHAARATLKDIGGNVCFAHTHKIATAVDETSESTIGAYSFGCLCELHPLWRDTDTTGWAHGYGLQIVGKDGSFMTIQVPIINGASYLKTLWRG